jgi:hypothetical protein
MYVAVLTEKEPDPSPAEVKKIICSTLTKPCKAFRKVVKPYSSLLILSSTGLLAWISSPGGFPIERI